MELSNLRAQLYIVHHLALKRAKDTHFEKVDDVNAFKDRRQLKINLSSPTCW